MAKSSSTRTPRKGAASACGRRPEWVRPYRRAQRALTSSANLVFATFDTAMETERCAKRRPVRSAQRLTRAVRRMVLASLRLADAQRELALADECLSRAPEEQNGDAEMLIELAAERCQTVAKYLLIAIDDATAVQVNVLAGLASGELVPEPPSDRRPRIILKPRLVSVRAFLAARRQPRVADRISPILRRRRRTPRPAAIRVPRPSILGRAPPLSSTCLL